MVQTKWFSDLLRRISSLKYGIISLLEHFRVVLRSQKKLARFIWMLYLVVFLGLKMSEKFALLVRSPFQKNINPNGKRRHLWRKSIRRKLKKRIIYKKKSSYINETLGKGWLKKYNPQSSFLTSD